MQLFPSSSIKSYTSPRGGTKSVFISPAMLESFGFNTYSWNDKIQNEEQAYARVPLVFRAVNLICDTLKQVPLYVYNENDEVIDAYPFQKESPLKDLIWKTQASRLLRGAALIVKLLDDAENNVGLQLLAPFTFHVKRIAVPGTTSMSGAPLMKTVFEQYVGTQKYPLNDKGYWDADEVIYMREYSPADDIGIGISSSFTSLNSAKLQRYIMRFATHFFEHGAMPVALASLPENTDESVVKQVQDRLQNSMSNLANAFNVTAVSGEIDIKKFTPDLNTLGMKDVRDQALEEIAWSFKIPKTVLSSSSANFATAEEEYKSFVMGTIGGLCESYQEALNPHFAELDSPCRIEYAIEEMHVMQVDEWRRSQAFANYVAAGLTPQAAAAQVGIEIDESAIAATGVTPGDTQTPSSIDTNVKAEMARWMTKAIKKIREGKHLNGEFKTEIIPLGLQERIRDGLKQAKTEKEIQQLFRQVEMH